MPRWLIFFTLVASAGRSELTVVSRVWAESTRSGNPLVILTCACFNKVLGAP